VVSYTVLLGILFVVLLTLLLTRRDFQTTILRQRGTTYQVTQDHRISNIFELNLTNKTRRDYKITLKLEDAGGKIELAATHLVLQKEQHLKERFIVSLPFNAMENGKKMITIHIYGNGREIEKTTTRFIGPIF